MDNFNKRRLNTQILTKTQMALQAIKRYDMEQSRVNILYGGQSSGKLLTELDYQYTKLTSHKVLKLDHAYKISLFSYSQEFYNLQMKNYIFPMRVVMKNVKNEGTLFIGYDQEYPVIGDQNRLKVFEKQSLNKQKNYDSKMLVNKDIIIILKNKGKKMINNVYFTIVAGKSFFMCDFKVQFLGLVRDERMHSQIKLNNQQKVVGQRYTEEIGDNFRKRTKTNPNYLNSGYSKQFVRTKVTLDKIERPLRVQQFSLLNNLEIVKHHSKSNVDIEQGNSKFTRKTIYNPTQTIRNKTVSTREFNNGHKRQKSELDFKIEEVKKNKGMIEQFRAKDKTLRQTASKCKRMIESYKKIFNEESVRKGKINKDLVLILYCSKFIRQVFNITTTRVKRQTNRIKVNYLSFKFVKKLKKAYAQTISMVPQKFLRTSNQTSSGLYLFSKIISKQSTVKASFTIKETFDYLTPLLLVNHSFSAANSYRASIKVIQKAWKTKYHARLSSLLYIVDNHVQKMFVQFPHFKIFLQDFYQSKSNYTICLEYIKDESLKYRYIYEAYRHKQEEIEQIIKMNSVLALEKNKSKKELKVPKSPCKPMHRFFRNGDILKSMVRTWFEIEYKKYSRKSQKKIKL